MKAKQVFIWHNGSEVPEVYRSFIATFGGPKGDLQVKPYTPDEDDLSFTRDEIIPNAVSRSHSVIMLLGDKENVEDADFVRLFESIAFSPRRIVISPVFLRPSAKDWWRENVETKIESLRNQCISPIEIWSKGNEPALLMGSERDSACVRLIEELRRRIEAKVRELDTTDFAISPPGWGAAQGREVLILSSAGQEYSELENELRNALIALPNRVRPIIWSGKWQTPFSQAGVGSLFEQPVLFVRIVTDTIYNPPTDVDFRRDVRAAIGLGNIDFGRYWEAITKSIRLDWAPNARKIPPSEAAGQVELERLVNDISPISTSIVCAGTTSAEIAHEIGRYLGVVKPAPPLVGYITIMRNPDRSSLVPKAEVFESNLKRALREALRDALHNRVSPADPDLLSYHVYDEMIDKEIRSGRVPIILADDLASTAQRPDIVEVLKLWEAQIRVSSARASKMTDIIRGALIYFNADDYRQMAQFPNEEIQSWFPLVVDDGGEIAPNQLRAMTSAVARAYPEASREHNI